VLETADACCVCFTWLLLEGAGGTTLLSVLHSLVSHPSPSLGAVQVFLNGEYEDPALDAREVEVINQILCFVVTRSVGRPIRMDAAKDGEGK